MEERLIDLYRLELVIPASRLDKLAAHLDAAEQARARSFRFADDSRRYVAAHGLLRERLGRLLETAPGAVVLRRGPQGKPFVDGLEISLSHAGDLALLAVAAFPVGIDVEERKRGQPEEVRQFLDPDELGSDLLADWCRHEARCKVDGQGLGVRPAADVRVALVDVGADYVAAVAARGQWTARCVDEADD